MSVIVQIFLAVATVWVFMKIKRRKRNRSDVK